MFLFDKSNTTSSPHITNETQNPKRNEKMQNLKSFTNKKDSARKAERATDTRPYYYCINDSCSCIVKYYHAHSTHTSYSLAWKGPLNDENYASWMDEKTERKQQDGREKLAITEQKEKGFKLKKKTSECRKKLQSGSCLSFLPSLRAFELAFKVLTR